MSSANNTLTSDQLRIAALEEQTRVYAAKIEELTSIVTELQVIKPSPKKGPRTHCKCGSTEHKNISHKDCPLNKNRPENFNPDEPRPEPKKRGRPKKEKKEVVSTSTDEVAEMLSNITLSEEKDTDSQATDINPFAFEQDTSDLESSTKKTKEDQMMDLFGEPGDESDEPVQENAEKEAKAAKKAAEKAAEKEKRDAEKAAKKAAEKEKRDAEKAAEKEAQAKKRQRLKAEKEAQKAEKQTKPADEATQLDELSELIAQEDCDEYVDAAKEFAELEAENIDSGSESEMEIEFSDDDN